MAKVVFTYPVQSIHGKVADNQFFSNRNGVNIMSVVKNPYNGEPTEKQVAAREKFAVAAANAREILKDNAVRAIMQTQMKESGYTGTLFGYVFKLEYAKL